MKLKDFDQWYQEAYNYWSNSDLACKDTCLQLLENLKNTVYNYFSYQGDNYVWFKRVLPTVCSIRMEKYHIRYSDPNVPEMSASIDYLPNLLSAFQIDLPDYTTLFSTYSSTQPCDIECGDSTTTTNPDGTTTTTYTCLDTTNIDNLKNLVQSLPERDVNNIMSFLDSIDSTDKSLYLAFKKDQIDISVDKVSFTDLAKEAGLDEVLSVYKWTIPGYNS
jgi:cobalamin biosynthesis Mg chelatase CobN